MGDLRLRSVKLRAAEDAPEGVIEGYIARFNDDYAIPGGLKERILPTTFTRSLESSGGVIPIMYQHDHKSPPIGTATVVADEVGLLMRASMFMDDARGRAVWNAYDAGAMNEFSVGFLTPNDGDVKRERDVEIINSGDLMEASCVLRGAANTNTIATRSEEHTEPETAPEPHASEEKHPEVPAELLARMAEPHVRSVIRSLVWANDIRSALADELRETYGSNPDVYVWIVDWSADKVIFELSGGLDAGTYEQTYESTDSDVELTGSKTSTTTITTYVPDLDD